MLEIREDSKLGRIVARVTGFTAHEPGNELGVRLELVTDPKDGTRPQLAFVRHGVDGTRRDAGVSLQVWRDAEAQDAPDLTVNLDPKEGPTLQVVCGGEVKTMNVSDVLEKLGV